jgi:hypothetical protein
MVLTLRPAKKFVQKKQGENLECGDMSPLY